jgi:hypothetical protein
MILIVFYGAENSGTYFFVAIIAVLGSVLIITMAPFIYGLNFIAIKGIRTGHVEVSDIFEGFRSGNFIRSWALLLVAMLMYLVAISMTYAAGVHKKRQCTFSYPGKH